jgi:hypothetical protein
MASLYGRFWRIMKVAFYSYKERESTVVRLRRGPEVMFRKSTIAFSILSACALGLSLRWPGTEGRPQTAAELIREMAATYANCRSYRDQGAVKTTSSSDNRVDEKPFWTEFIRPDYFRFEYDDRLAPFFMKWNRNYVWLDHGEVWDWFAFNKGKEREKSLDLALACATGVSGGSAHRVPRLLMPKNVTWGRSLVGLLDPKVECVEKIDGHPCYRVTGRYAPGMDATVWIDVDSHLIRQVLEVFKSHGFQQLTTYEPEIDVAIARHSVP